MVGSSGHVSIAGTVLDPQPDAKGGLVWSLMDIQSSDSGRTEDGTMQMTVVAQKRKLNFKFSNITAEKATAILSLMQSTFFDVTYFDPLLNAPTTKTFYKGDRKASWYSFVCGADFSELSFNLIEQ
jgi:hypothetical protein